MYYIGLLYVELIPKLMMMTAMRRIEEKCCSYSTFLYNQFNHRLVGWQDGKLCIERNRQQLVRLHMSSSIYNNQSTPFHCYYTHHSLQYSNIWTKARNGDNRGRRCARFNQSSLFHFFLLFSFDANPHTITPDGIVHDRSRQLSLSLYGRCITLSFSCTFILIHLYKY